jgi:hypothetical protein
MLVSTLALGDFPFLVALKKACISPVLISKALPTICPKSLFDVRWRVKDKKETCFVDGAAGNNRVIMNASTKELR